MHYLEEYYTQTNENERLTLRTGMVEYTTTMEYIGRYLQPDMRIIEIGAGTGRYSHALAQRGYTVDAVELIQHNIDVFNQNTLPGENISITQGNAVNLSAFNSDTYDITLLLGPMYHLHDRDEKRQALSEAIRVTKKGGIIFTAYCMADASILDYGFKRGNIHSVIEQGILDPKNFEPISNPRTVFELHRKEDIEKMRSIFNVTQLHFVATDGYARHMRQTVFAMDDETFNLYLRYHLATCERQDLIGYSNHTLDIFRKD